jgi:hypothetical protein
MVGETALRQELCVHKVKGGGGHSCQHWHVNIDMSAQSSYGTMLLVMLLCARTPRRA